MGDICSRAAACCSTNNIKHHRLESRELPVYPQEGPEYEYKVIVDNATSHINVPCDTWGAAMFLMVTDLPHFLSGEYHYESMLRTGLVLICYLMNICLQFAVVYWIMIMVTLPGVRDVQDVYRRYHLEAFTLGNFNLAHFNGMGDYRREVCELSLNSCLFLSVILFLWASQCMQEFRTINRMRRQIASLPHLPDGISDKRMISTFYREHEHFTERKIILCCLNNLTYVLIITCMLIPKLLIVSFLCVLGSVWLTASANYGDLILNALALAFVTQIDEMIFSSFLPPRLAKNLMDLKIAMPVPPDETAEERESRDIKEAYTRSVFFLLMIVVYVVVFVVFQPVLPYFAYDATDVCSAYMQKEAIPWCMPWNSSSCFPYGTGLGAATTTIAPWIVGTTPAPPYVAPAAHDFSAP